MTSTSRGYYEKNLGAGMFIAPETEHGFTGYTEPPRRFIQPQGYTPQVNEIQNQMPSWLPGQDYLVNFQKGDPYIKVDEMDPSMTMVIRPGAFPGPHKIPPRARGRPASTPPGGDTPACPGSTRRAAASLASGASRCPPLSPSICISVRQASIPATAAGFPSRIGSKTARKRAPQGSASGADQKDEYTFAGAVGSCHEMYIFGRGNSVSPVEHCGL